MIVLGIDPGPKVSGACKIDVERWQVISAEGDIPTASLRRYIDESGAHMAVVEDVEPRGMPMGHDIIRTLRWLGRIKQHLERIDMTHVLVQRRTVKMTLCNSVRASDANVNAMVRRHFCEHHDMDEREAMGTKKLPGPCYGIKRHAWPAAAAIVAYCLGALPSVWELWDA